MTSSIVLSANFLLLNREDDTRTWGRTPETAAVAKLAGLIEIVLWVSVATAAVWIPNY